MTELNTEIKMALSKTCKVCVLMVLSVFTNVAYSQTGGSKSAAALEEIVVTATKTGATDLQETPIAITAFSGVDLERSVASDIRDLAHNTPGLVISENTTLAQIFIRGVGSNNVFAGADPSSTIHMDGVYLARPATSFTNFLDVERIEVLRGPQGTIYGRNSVGGTINVISRKPSFDEFKYKGQVTVGNEDLLRFEGYTSAPLIENSLAASAAFQYSDRDGFRDNVTATGVDLDDEDELNFRGQIRLQVTASIEAILRADYSKQDIGVYGFHSFVEPPAPAAVANSVFGDSDKVALDFPNSLDQELWGISLELNAELNQSWSLRSLTAYRDDKTDIRIDGDASELDIQRTLFDERQDQLSQEFNLSGNFERATLLLGLYYIHEDLIMPSNVQVRAMGLSRRVSPLVDTKSWAVFGQASYDLTEQLTFTAGIRYTEEDKEFTKGDGLFVLGTAIQIADLSFPTETGKYSAITPKFGIEYKPADNLMFYASATRGFKSGGFNFTAVLPGGYDEEDLWAYEFGVKSDFAGDRLRLNATGFFYDYEDLQVQAFVVPGQVDVSNAATASITGVEVEAMAKPTAELDLSLSVSYLDAEYDEYTAAPVFGGGTVDASGRRLNNSPEWSYSLSAQYTRDFKWGSIYLRGDYSWQDEIFFTADNNDIDRQASYGLLNGSVGYVSRDQRLEIALWTRNLTDEEYVTGTAQFPLVRAGRFGSPRTFGIRISYQN